MATPVQKQLGILGGGQLARMLVEAASRADIQPYVYAQSAHEPAALINKLHTVGALNNEAQLRAFMQKMPLVTFESEFVDCDLLSKANTGGTTQIQPSLAALKVLQDKLSQKRLCQKLAIGTTRFEVVSKDTKAWLSEAPQNWPFGFVLKWSRQGYDGKGVFVVADPKKLDVAKALSFIADGTKLGAQIYAEEFVRYAYEVAMVGARDESNTHVFYPLVISEQRNGICKYVRGPASNFGIDEKTEQLAQNALAKIADALGYCGALAVEFFLDTNGRLLVNEVAPRVHNTGHYSQDACMTSQFENHLRAVYGRGIKPTQLTHQYFGMINILGPDVINQATVDKQAGIEGLRLHWYDKATVKPGRKMGHINIFANDKSSFDTLWRHALAVDARWMQFGQLTLEESDT